MPETFTVALHANENHRKALAGGWRIDGHDVRTVPLANGEMYSRVFGAEDIDIAEMSIARYARLCSEKRSRLVAVPYYFARKFPHRYFYVRSDFEGDDLATLKGRTVGLSEYDHTGHTWARALLEDGYGVPPSSVRWISARRELDRPPVKADFRPPADVDLVYAPAEKTLSQMLLNGEIDAILNPNVPSCFTEMPDRVRRLVGNVRGAEIDFYRRTGICPIQHVLGIRRDLLERHPQLAEAAVQALDEAIGSSRRLWENGPADAASVALSGLEAGERRSLETFLRHHHSQGMSQRRIELSEFFAGQQA